MIFAGAIPAALLAISLDFILSILQKIKAGNLKIAIWFLPVFLIILSSLYLLPSLYRGNLLAGFTPEFMGRQDGYLGLRDVYDLNMQTVVISDAVMYKAAYEKKLDVISGYSTDGRLKAYGLTILKDDKNIFPPYYAAPVIREDFLKKFPEVEDALNLLAGHINDSIMTELNYRVDFLKQQPTEVAQEFLKSKGLYKEPLPASNGTFRIGSKIFGEQYILAAMYTMLVRGNTHLNVETKTGLGGTKICFDALTNNQIDMYPEYTGTGLLVILKPSDSMVNNIVHDAQKTYQYVSQNFLSTYHLKWLKPIGFNNAYALMMRESTARQLHIRNISDLKHFVSEH